MGLVETSNLWTDMFGSMDSCADLTVLFGDVLAHRFALWLQPLVNIAISGKWVPRKKFLKTRFQHRTDGRTYSAKIVLSLPDPLVAYQSAADGVDEEYLGIISFEQLQLCP